MTNSVRALSASVARPQAAADPHALALVASSLVAATVIAFLAMVFTAWPAGAQGSGLQVAGLPPALLQEAPLARTAPQPVMPRPAEAPTLVAPSAPGAARTAALGTLPRAAQPCTEELAAAEADMNATLARVEAIDEADAAGLCAAFRVHAASLQRAASAADRCMQSPQRQPRASFLRQSLAEWRSVIANGCP